MSNPGIVQVEIEVPRWGFIKRKPDQRIDIISPLPCPFNYGSLPNTVAPDGDPIDAIVLGPRLAQGERLWVPVLGAVRFIDADQEDPKLICGDDALTWSAWLQVQAFFSAYARYKKAIYKVQGKRGRVAFEGWVHPGSVIRPD